MGLVLPAGIAILVLTLLLDLLEMSFGRILWFVKTLRYWLYFTLHFGISCLAAYFLHTKLPDWYLLAPAASFLGVAIISNTNIKLAGFSLVPIADTFVSIKAKMIEQAGQDKASKLAIELRKAHLVQRLRKLDAKKLEDAYSAALIAANWSAERVQSKVDKARADSARDDQAYLKIILIDILLKVNLAFVEANIESWEAGN